jgi:hypothetical protein
MDFANGGLADCPHRSGLLDYVYNFPQRQKSLAPVLRI